MIGEWHPTDPKTSIDLALLATFVTLGQTILAAPVALEEHLSKQDKQRAQAWIKLKEEDWQPTLAQIQTPDLLPLAAFFTLAEQQLNGFECGAKNPAIWIFRYLRKNGNAPEKSTIHALKKLTDNRFIPYGSIG
ncbi:MAG: hypothetical protein WAO12_09760 [Venatoribacter sp.]